MQAEKVKSQYSSHWRFLDRLSSSSYSYSVTAQVLAIDVNQITPYVCLGSGRNRTTRSIPKGERLSLLLWPLMLISLRQLRGDAGAAAR